MNNTRVIIEGEAWDLYSVECEHEGIPFSFDIYARTQQEADSMLRSIRTKAVEANRIAIRIPAIPGADVLVRSLCWIRNLFSC